MKLSPYLSFDRQCRAALRHYERCLGGRTVYMMTYAESPTAEQVPADWGDLVYHATFALGDQTIGAADAPPGTYQRPQGFSLTLEIAEPAEAERVFELLAASGTVEMALQETHWAQRFGVCTDQFGIHWYVNCGAPS